MLMLMLMLMLVVMLVVVEVTFSQLNVSAMPSAL